MTNRKANRTKQVDETGKQEAMPLPIGLARITAILANHDLPWPLTRANVAQWTPPTARALALWQACQSLLAELPQEQQNDISIQDLASLAATLSNQKGWRGGAEILLASAAFRLLQHCQSDHVAPIATSNKEMESAIEKVLNPPEPSQYPVPFKEALRRILPAERVSEREELFRAHLKDKLRRSSRAEGETITDDKILEVVGEKMARLKNVGFDQDEYRHYAYFFPRWACEYSRLRLKARGKAAAGARHRFQPKNIIDLKSFVEKLRQPADRTSEAIRQQLAPATQKMLFAYAGGKNPQLHQALADDIAKIIDNGGLLEAIELYPKSKARPLNLPKLHRMWLEKVYPDEIAFQKSSGRQNKRRGLC